MKRLLISVILPIAGSCATAGHDDELASVICPWDNAYRELSAAEQVRHCEATHGFVVFGPPTVVSGVNPSSKPAPLYFSYCRYESHARPIDACRQLGSDDDFRKPSIADGQEIHFESERPMSANHP